MKRDRIFKLTLVTIISFVCLAVSSIYVGTSGENESSFQSSFNTNIIVPSNVPPADLFNRYDINGDGVIDLLDINLVILHYGETGFPGWIPEDVNFDGEVGLPDLAGVSLHIGSDGTVIPPDFYPMGPFAFTTNVSIEPSSQTVGPGDSFTVNVSVEPGEPINGVAFSLSFDDSLVHAESVTLGDLFDPYLVFFVPGTIDNTSGTITSVYGFTIPATNTVSDPGTFCTISFTAQSVTGLSTLHLYDVCVTDINGECVTDISVNDCSVQVDATPPDTALNALDDYYNSAPSIGGTATDQSYGDLDKIEMRIQRDSDSNYWTGSAWQSDPISFDAATGLSGWLNVAWTASSLPSSWDNEVTYTFDARAYDDVGNVDPSNASDSFTYDISDPATTIDDIPDYVNSAPDIEGDATDNVELDYVEVEITDGTNYWDGGAWTATPTWLMVSGLSGTSDSWDLTTDEPVDGDYTNGQLYTVSARAADKAGNVESTATDSFTFDITLPSISNVDLTFSDPIDTDPTYGWENITCDVTDATSGVNEVYVNLTYPDLHTESHLMTDGGGGQYYYNTTYTDVGNYSYYIWASDNAQNEDSSSTNTFQVPPNWDIDLNGHIFLPDLVQVSLKYDQTGSNGWIREDVDNSGKVFLPDLVQVSLHYDEHWYTGGLRIPISFPQGGRGTTYVNITPSSQTVGPGDSFTVDVYVVPGEPINGVAFSLSFDESLVHAEWVTLGDLFDPYWVFFNPGTIDNTSGTITSVYGFTIPATNTVSDPGTFCTISFTAQSSTGTSTIHLYGVCVTNITGNCVTDISVNDGSVTVAANAPPVISNPFPGDGATGVSVGLSELSVTIEDPEGDSFDWSIETSPDIGDSSGSGEGNGTKTCTVSGLSYNTVYTWYVNATDPGGSGQTTSEVYTFTTEPEPNYPPVISNPDPGDGATGVSVGLSELSVTIKDPEGDSFDWSIETSPNIGDSSGFGEGNGTKTCSVSGLSYNTVYTWYVNATDPGGSGQTTAEVYTFTTEENDPPEFSNEDPYNGKPGVSTTTTSLYVDIADPDGDFFDWSIDTSPDIGSNSGIGEINGTKSCPVSDLEYETTYTWYVNATDPGGSGQTTAEVYTFTTESEYNTPPVFLNESPADGAININVSNTTFLSVYILDVDGDSFDWSIETSPDIGSDSGTGYDGIKICLVSGLEYETTYTWYVNATDPAGSGETTSEEYTFTTEKPPNDPPGAPKITGQIDGKVGIKYEYTLNAEDPEGENVSYYVDWDDGTFIDWFGPYTSGLDVKVHHTWTEAGSYTITARARDVNGSVGPDGYLDVIMTRNKPMGNALIAELLEKLMERFPLLEKIFTASPFFSRMLGGLI